MGRFAVLNDFFDVTVGLPREIPLAWVPLTLTWPENPDALSIVFIIFIGAIFPILLNTIDGVRGVKNTCWLVFRPLHSDVDCGL